jgi:glucose-6-phosphate 1-dehydrogenase
MQHVTARDAVLGQYAAGTAEDGTPIAAYLDEPGVPRGSRTPTFASIRARIDNWRWHGVPFVLRTGKRLAARSTRIVVRFRPAPVTLFTRIPGCGVGHNVLTIFIQPDEGFSLTFEVKQPGDRIRIGPRALDFYYREAFPALADAYETLLGDVIEGDLTLFVSAGWAERSWELYRPLLEAPPQPTPYPAGTWGPSA